MNINVVCPHCFKVNRIPKKEAYTKANCGGCKNYLSLFWFSFEGQGNFGGEFFGTGPKYRCRTQILSVEWGGKDLLRAE